MRLRAKTLLVFLAMLSQQTSAGVLLAQGADPKPRTMDVYFAQPFAARLLPDDTLVVIRRNGISCPIVLNPAPSSNGVVDFATRSSDVVVVVTVTNATSFLADEESWIRTRLEGTVREVLRDTPRRRVHVGQQLAANLLDGELKIGSVTVRTESFPPPPFSAVPLGETYLLFLYQSDDGGLYFSHTPLLVRNGRLEYFGRYQIREQTANPLQGRRLRDVASRVRRVKVE